MGATGTITITGTLTLTRAGRMKTKTPYPPLGGMESGAQAPSLFKV